MTTQNLLTIRDYLKTIPYEPAVRPDGSTCHGFKLLKWLPASAVTEIEEVSDLDALRDAVVRINNPQSSFITVGCEKAFNEHEGTFWARGYIEFAFNYREFAADAQWYFKVFFDFANAIRDRKFDEPVQFLWELDGAQFTTAGFIGYSSAVWITTADLSSAAETKRVWCAAVDFLSEFLAAVPARGESFVFPGPSV